MPKIAKYLLIAFGGLISLILIIVGIVAATFNPNDYKPLVIKLVQEKKQRTLAIPGNIKLTFFPKIGADLGQISISEHNSPNEFAAVSSAKVSLALMPLLAKQLVIDRIKIDGISASIKRYKDGSTNFDDLLSKEESPSEQIKFDIDSVSITNSKILFDDQQLKRKTEIANLNFDSGHIANGVPSKINVSANLKNDHPKVDILLALKSGFTFDLDKKHYVLKGLDASISGALLDYTGVSIKAAGDADVQLASKQFILNDIALSASAKHAAQTIDAKLSVPKLAITDTQVAGSKLSGAAKLTEAARTLSAEFSLPEFKGSPTAFTLPDLSAELVLKEAKTDAKAKISGTITGDIDKLLFTSKKLSLVLDGKQAGTAISGTLATAVSANLNTQIIDLSALAAAFDLPNPHGGSLKFKADGNLNLNLAKQNLAANLKGNLDQSAFDAKLGLTKFSPLASTFDVKIDQIDIDRYQKKSAATSPAASTPAAPEQPIDLSALKDLNTNGSIKIGSLKAENIKASNVRVDIRAAAGKIDISPLAASLYGGSTTGAVTVHASSPPRFSVKQNMVGINIGPLLKDAMNKEPVEGKGNVQLDINTTGATVTQMKKTLAGTAQMELRDGAVKGVNLAQVIRGAKAKLGAITGAPAPQTGTSSANEKSDFSELKASFKIANGIARNDDLSAKSPLFRLGGAGDINLVSERLDYVVKATVVTTLQGQGGPELQALKGITIPVKLTGPFTAIDWKIDFGAMVGDIAKQKIEERKEEIKTRVGDKLKESLKGLFGK